jgi:hypothetical protein
MTQTTNYGYLIARDSPLLIVAPHGYPHNDWDTDNIAAAVAEMTGASLLVNAHVNRSTGPGSKTDKDTDLKLNIKHDLDLKVKLGIKDVESGKQHPLNEKIDFLKALQSLTYHARDYSPEGLAVIAYLHGIADRRSDVVADIGCGMEQESDGLVAIKGKSTVDKETVKVFQGDLGTLLELNYKGAKNKVGVGRYFRAEKPWNLVQFHQGTKDQAFQLEMATSLRERPRFARLLAYALESSFSGTPEDPDASNVTYWNSRIANNEIGLDKATRDALGIGIDDFVYVSCNGNQTNLKVRKQSSHLVGKGSAMLNPRAIKRLELFKTARSQDTGPYTIRYQGVVVKKR